MDDDGKMEQDCSAGVTIDAESEIDPCKVDGTCPEVIKVYIFKADTGGADLGKEKPLARCVCFVFACIQLSAQGIL